MNKTGFCLPLLFLILVGPAGGQTLEASSVLAGDWACYGYDESEASMYHVDYSIIYSRDGTWSSEGQFGEMEKSGGLLPFEWDFIATGTWVAENGMLVSKTASLRFMPTRGGKDYEAADPRDYLRIPFDDDWRLELVDPMFMTLEPKNGGLLIECDKQVFD